MRILLITAICASLSIPLFFAIAQEAPVELDGNADQQIQEKQQQIKELEKQIEDYQKEITNKGQEAQSIKVKLAILQSQINKINATVKALRLAAEETRLKAQLTSRSIAETKNEIDRRKLIVAEQIRLLDRQDAQRQLLPLVFMAQRFSDTLNIASDILTFEGKLNDSLRLLLGLQDELHSRKISLDESYKEQAQLIELRKIEQGEVAKKEQAQRGVYDGVKGEEKKLKEQVGVTQAQINSLRDDVYALAKIGVTVEDAVKFGELVATRAGIRPAFLIALLEVESRMGLSIGTGNWKKDMNPNQHTAFLEVTSKLKLDPDILPVSRKPDYGWGGAMGPAQFLPQTWLGYEAEIITLTGHNPPSPWNIEDAFMAAAIKLGNDGARAQTRDGELRAAKKYISGSATCTKSICTYYSNLVLDKADDIEKKLR